MQFAYTILYVPDVAATLHFYEQAFGCSIRFLTPDESYGELETAGTTLSFASEKLARTNLTNDFIPQRPDKNPAAVEVGFTTKDVDGAYHKAIAAGASGEAEPSDKPHGQRVAYVRDLNGFLVEICTPMN
jgi:catechol 2,3-dioxygenase-like lactoylglutathione lyase family enzyme